MNVTQEETYQDKDIEEAWEREEEEEEERSFFIFPNPLLRENETRFENWERERKVEEAKRC